MPHVDPHEPPLAPKICTKRPPYWPVYKEYHGRPEWWLELGYTDELLRMGRQTGVFQNLREKDRQWFDSKVPDGTSIYGPFQLDSQYHKNTTIKADQPGNFFEFQKKVREGSRQYKQIAEKWDISEQHPGILVNPLGNTLHHYDNKYLGRQPFNMNYLNPIHYGPRFWDKPINEGCLEKGLSMTKYAALYTFAYSFIEAIGYRGRNIQHHVGHVKVNSILKNWVTKHAPIPMVLAFTFGASVCTAATIRNVDDSWNWSFACFMTGLAQMTMHNNSMSHGFLVALPLLGITLVYQQARIHYHGLQGMTSVQMFGGKLVPYSSPLSWKYFPGVYGDPAKPHIDQINKVM